MSELFDNNTNKQGLIVYGGESSSDYGMVVAEAPSFERPQRKQTTYSVPGRNGVILFQQNAWNDTTRSYKVWLAEAIEEDSGGVRSGYLVEKVNAFEAMLNSKVGYQRLTDNFEPDIFRLAYYSGGDDFSNQMTQYGEATIRFNCRPERFLLSGDSFVTVANGGSITNPTKFDSKPLIKITVSSTQTITVAIAGTAITANVDDYIYIDCEAMNAYRQDGENKNTDISGTFPVIKANSSNAIVITGTVTKVEIKPRYFTV